MRLRDIFQIWVTIILKMCPEFRQALSTYKYYLFIVLLSFTQSRNFTTEIVKVTFALLSFSQNW